jgi:hypothetical protein
MSDRPVGWLKTAVVGLAFVPGVTTSVIVFLGFHTKLRHIVLLCNFRLKVRVAILQIA